MDIISPIRSTEIADLKISANIGINAIKTASYTLLTHFPTYNNNLSKRLGFYKKENDGYMTWSPLKDDAHLQKTEENPTQQKKNLMIDQDIVEAYNYGHMSKDEVEKQLRYEVGIYFSNIIDIIRTFIKYHPERSYQAGIARHFGWDFDFGKSQNCRVIANFIDFLSENGDIKKLESKPKNAIGGKWNCIWLQTTDIVTLYKHKELDIYIDYKSASLGESQAAHKLREWAHRGVTFEHQYTFSNCINTIMRRKLPFDFKVIHKDLPGGFMLLEIDGMQHYKPIEYFGGLDASTR